MLDPTENGVLGAIKSQFKDIYLPALKRMDKGWGDLAGENGERERSKFLNDMENFILVLESASSSSNTIDLAPCTTFDLNSLKTANDFYNVANSFESMEKIEACIAVWIKQIAQVVFYIPFFLAQTENPIQNGSNKLLRFELAKVDSQCNVSR